MNTDVPKRRVSRQLEEVSGSAVSSLTPRQTIVGPGPSFPNSAPSAVSTCLIVTVSRVVSSIHLHWLCKHCLCTCLITPRVLSYFLYSMLPSQWLLSSNVKNLIMIVLNLINFGKNFKLYFIQNQSSLKGKRLILKLI